MRNITFVALGAALALVPLPASAFEDDCGLEPPGSFSAPPVDPKPFETPFVPGEPPLVQRVRPLPAIEGIGGFSPFRPRTGALTGKTVYVSAGHGFTWTQSLSAWHTQRGNTHDIVEDLVSIEAINQYLVPYLQNAGARVVTVRESDLNTAMVIVDNGGDGYSESGDASRFSTSTLKGWATSSTPLSSGTNPFDTGSNRLMEASPTATAHATWAPEIPSDGHYNVYVSWSDYSYRLPDAHYAVRHAGGESHFRVNQRRHGFTWVLLGRFYFKAGRHPETASVVAFNDSKETGNVSLDAVRFGGGMGLIDRGQGVSGRPRFEESARYHAQFSGAPTSVYDYSNTDPQDDVGTRSRFAAWDHEQGEDAVYVAWHTNAASGPAVGTVSYVYGPNPVDGTYNFTGVPGSEELVGAIHSELVKDLRAGFDPAWRDRGKYTAYFGEVNPNHNSEMPSCLIEVAFHSTASDAARLKEPAFRRTASRAFMQGIIRYFSERDGKPVAFPPEPPSAPFARNLGDGEVEIGWRSPAPDPGGGDAPTGYVVYVSRDGLAWDEGTLVEQGYELFREYPAGETRYFRIASVNAAGESLPSEIVGVGVSAEKPPVLLVGGFDRLDASQLLVEDLSRHALKKPLRMLLHRMNDFSYAPRHGEAIAAAGHGFDSASNEALGHGDIESAGYAAVDWFAGRGGSAGVPLTETELEKLRAFVEKGGSLLISGASVASGLHAAGGAHRELLEKVLGASFLSAERARSVSGAPDGFLATLSGLLLEDGAGSFYDPGPLDGLTALGAGLLANFDDKRLAGVASEGTGRTVLLSFPFEAVANEAERAELMRRLLAFLVKRSEPPPPEQPAPPENPPPEENPDPPTLALFGVPFPSEAIDDGAGGEAGGCGCGTGASADLILAAIPALGMLRRRRR